MSKHGWILLVAIVISGCAMLQRARQPPAGAGASALSQECSNLRADIDSARYRQRSQPATSNAPVIADAANAKADQGIDVLQLRYESLGCAKSKAKAKAKAADTSAVLP
jgi:hypothetical protein